MWRHSGSDEVLSVSGSRDEISDLIEEILRLLSLLSTGGHSQEDIKGKLQALS